MSEELRIHNVIMEERKKISMTGVKDVKGFDEETIVLDTVAGTLTVKGEGLSINGFSAESGDIKMEGEIKGLVYTGESGKGILSRIFR